ncbi:hypothetical protein OKC48_06795 [Methylorubrum extorquens]|uniref:hypothetical protein n=1 Tax=Methylorubrum extorquens TaxID=408 RepID=UPI002238A0BC|nr:hypothetical protein [Methylorubrum extorquens]UYW28222.1 hypothetical protein OKC48_06795 [Methylorubrum extorquens]
MRNDPDYSDASDAPSYRELRSSTHVARKPHLCDDCPRGRGVMPGERVWVQVFLDDGEFCVRRTCATLSCVMEEAAAPAHVDLREDELAF